MIVSRIQWRPLVAVGLVSGLVQVVAGVVMYLSGVYFAVWTGPVTRVLLAVCIAGGTWWYVKQVLGGRSTYLTSLLVGIAIAVCTGLVYVTYNIVSISFVYPHFLDDMAQARFAHRQSAGLDQAQARWVLESLRAQTTIGGVAASNFRACCLVGTVLSALTAIGFRKGAGIGRK